MVVDNAGVLKGGDITRIVQAAQELQNEGADVHVVFESHSLNLDLDEAALEKQCVEWQSATGGRKNTLITILTAPTDHKLGLYYGGAWHKALDDNDKNIRAGVIAPRYKDGNWAGGAVAGLQALTARVKASKDQALHPVVAQTTTVNQATDLTGLWTVMKWIVGILFLACLGGFGLAFLVRRARKNSAQREAQNAKAFAASDIDDARDHVATAKATLHPRVDEADALLTRAMTLFTSLTSQEKTNPEQGGLSEYDYTNMAASYGKVRDICDQITHVLNSNEDGATFPEEPEEKPHTSHVHAHHRKAHAATAGISAESVESTPVERSSSTIVIPVPIPYEREREESRPSWEPPSHRDDGYVGSSDDNKNDDNGGGSNSFGGSDSGGGSSDFGGSDSGGGGSSDSGSSDSGGGGSSDF